MKEKRKSPSIRPMAIPMRLPFSSSTPPPDTPGCPSVRALTNPLLAPENYKTETFSKAGMKEIDSTNTLNDIVQRNVVGESPGAPLVDFTQEGWSAR